MSATRSTTSKNTRQIILDQAEALFSKQGYGGTTLDHIASAVGIKRPSLIYHFSDKEELYEAMLEQVFLRQREFFSNSNESTLAPDHHINLLLDHWLDYALLEPNYLRLFLHNLAAGYQADGLFWKQARPIVRLWEAALLRGARQGVFREVDLIHFLSIVGGMTAYYILMQSEDKPLDSGSSAWQEFSSQLRQSINSLILKP